MAHNFWGNPGAINFGAPSNLIGPKLRDLSASAPNDPDASAPDVGNASTGGGAGSPSAGKLEAITGGTGGADAEPTVGTAGLGGGAGAGATPGPLPSVGCSASSLPAGGLLLEEAVTLRGARRVYSLAVPANPLPGSPLALVFVLHGRGGTGSGIRAQFALEERAGNAAIFVYPTAFKDDGGAGLTTWDRERVDSVTCPTFWVACAATCCAPSRPLSGVAQSKR